jgi:hypothetical protein
VRRTDGNLGSAPITFSAELVLYRLEPAQKLRCHHLIDVIGAGAKIRWRCPEKRSQNVCMVGEVRTEVNRSRFGSPQK